MAAWQWALDTAAVVLLGVLLYGLVLVVRRWLLSREGGTFELSVRLHDDRPGRGWALGMGRYRGERLEWFRIFTPSPRPKLSWQRNELEFSTPRTPAAAERTAIYAGHLIVEGSSPRGRTEMAMSKNALTGLLSWLEAGPPGQRAGKGG
jgi:hypothetical protein